MRKVYLLLLLIMMACLGCEWKLQSSDSQASDQLMVIDRYDQLELRYLTTGDFAALQEMNIEYPIETRMLIENLLQLGPANDPELKTKLLVFFQDSTLQTIIHDVQHDYADMTDIEEQLSESFHRLKQMLPSLMIPRVYTQISSLDQSIVAGEGFLGISLDKYLGKDYPLYVKYGYSEWQRSMMTRSFIVPDCLAFYLLTLYPETDTTLTVRDNHRGRIQYVVNKALDERFFDNEQVRKVEQYMSDNQKLTVQQLLESPF